MDAPITARETLTVEAAAQATSSVLPPSLCRRARMPVGPARLRTTMTLFVTLSRRVVRPTEGPACPVPPSLPSRCPSFRCLSSCHPTRLHPPPRWTPLTLCVRHVEPDIPPTQASFGRRLRPVPLPVPPPSRAHPESSTDRAGSSSADVPTAMVGDTALVPGCQGSLVDLERYDVLVYVVKDVGQAWSTADLDRIPRRSGPPRR